MAKSKAAETEPSYICSIELNSLVWDIHIQPQDAFKKQLQEDGVAWLGATLKDRDQIWLWDGIRTPERLRRTIMHEIAHAVIESFGFNQWNAFSEETLADFIESYGAMIADLTDMVIDQIKGHKKKAA